MASQREIQSWFERRRLTLDMAGLTEQEREEGSMLLGGSAASFVSPDEDFDFSHVSTLVFRWGDPKAEEMFAILLEHDDRPGADFLPFSPSAVAGDMVWSMTLQERGFDPVSVYPSEEYYYVVPYDAETGPFAIEQYLTRPTPRPELLAKIWTRWVAFGVGTNIR